MLDAGLINTIKMVENNFTFDPLEVEFIEGKAQVIKRGPISDELFVATFREGQNLDVSSGPKETTLLAGTIFENGHIVGDGQSDGGLQIDASNAFFTTKRGHVRVKFIPNFDSYGPGDSYLLAQSLGVNTNASKFMLQVAANGHVNVFGYDKNGAKRLDLRTPFLPVKDQEYLIDVFWDLENNKGGILIDGILQTLTFTNIQNPIFGLVGYVVIGGDSNLSTSKLFGKVRDIEVFSEIQTEASYTPAAAVYIYPENISFDLKNHIGLDLIESFEYVGHDDSTFIVEVNKANMYFDGVDSWLLSDGTIGQSNTAEEINAGLEFFALVGTTTFGLRIFLLTDKIETSEIENVVVEYNFSDVIDDVPNCLIYGDVSDILEEGSAAKIVIVGEPFIIGEKIVFPAGEFPIVDGQFAFKMISTESLAHALTISIVQDVERGTAPEVKFENVIIPDKAFSTLPELQKLES